MYFWRGWSMCASPRRRAPAAGRPAPAFCLRFAQLGADGRSVRLGRAMGDPRGVFKAYDVRGTFPDQIDAELCRAIGAAVARFTGAERLLVVRDMRPSGVQPSEA